VFGVRELLRKIKSGLLSETEITDKTLQDCFWTAGIPEPDLIIRTGGAKRISNFLLYQAAYAELYFLDCFWPEITKEHLAQAYYKFTQCQRNFGV
jgi:undecaprenyl diphosphate synthase